MTPPPAGLRERIKIQLTTVSFEEDGTQISVERGPPSPGPSGPNQG